MNSNITPDLQSKALSMLNKLSLTDKQKKEVKDAIVSGTCNKELLSLVRKAIDLRRRERLHKSKVD